MFVNKTFRITRVQISQKMEGVIMRNLEHCVFYVKKDISTDFHICISVPLTFLHNTSNQEDISSAIHQSRRCSFEQL